MKSGDKIISEFNKGKATVRVEIPAKLADKKVAAIHIADDGKIEQLAGKILTVGGKKFYEFTTPHLSQLSRSLTRKNWDWKLKNRRLTPRR